MTVIVALLTGQLAAAQPMGVTRIDTVPAPSLRNNLVGDPDRRLMSIYLPPSYLSEQRRNYPVLYLLHGFDADHRAFIRGAYQNLSIRLAMDSLIGAGAVHEMIVVLPDARNAFTGSYYTNSPVTGKWEDFIARDLVRHVDRKYRTLRSREARGIAGHSMGGYGALHVALENPDVFSAVYALSPCCLGFDAVGAQYEPHWRTALHVSAMSEVAAVGFWPRLLLARAAALSPNTANYSVFADLPFVLVADSLVLNAAVAEKWRQTPLARSRRSGRSLRRLRIGFDAGDADGFPDIPLRAAQLDSILTALGIPHDFELYAGGHGDRIRSRIEGKLLPFMSRALNVKSRKGADR